MQSETCSICQQEAKWPEELKRIQVLQALSPEEREARRKISLARLREQVRLVQPDLKISEEELKRDFEESRKEYRELLKLHNEGKCPGK